LKCAIIYYSQTGNTEKIAKQIQAGIIQEAGNCDLIKLKEADPKHLYQYDLIGIGSPVYRREPLNVAAFIKSLGFVGGKHAFVFCTHGTIPTLYMHSIVPKMKRRGLVVIGRGDWYGDCFLPWHPEPYPTAGHPDEIDLKEAKEFGREMVKRSIRISKGEKGLLPPTPKKPEKDPNDTPALRATIQDTVEDPSVFKYHKELCKYPKCRLCMDNCPTYSIDLSMNPPMIAHKCQPHCCYCTLLCPTGAIEIDDYVKDQAPKYYRTTTEYALPCLDRDEANGYFRRLLPVEKIGWDTYFYKMHPGHPKFIIGKGPV
jgi:flavodoxin/Fe-S-cluster-containing hydrogenase component 2